VTVVEKKPLYGRTMGDSSIVNIVGVAKIPRIKIIYRNQLIIKSPRFLLKERKKTKSILN
jgi:hypothetical protein